MGFLGAIGRAVGAVPGMKTMNKALPGNGMPGVNPQQSKPQLGGGLGPSIKSPQMNQQMMPQAQQMGNQMMKSFARGMNMPQMQSPPIQAQGPPMQKQFPQMGENRFLPTSPQGGGFQMPPWARGGMNGRMGGGMGPSPMGMPPWMRGGYGGVGMTGQPTGGGYNPNIQTMMPNRQIQTMMPQGGMMAGNPNRNMPQ